MSKMETNETVVSGIDNTWSADSLDFVDYSPGNKAKFRYILVIIDIFSKHVLSIPFKNKYGKTITDEF